MLSFTVYTVTIFRFIYPNKNYSTRIKQHFKLLDDTNVHECSIGAPRAINAHGRSTTMINTRNSAVSIENVHTECRNFNTDG